MSAVSQFRMLPTGDWHLAVQARRAYHWQDDGRLEPAPVQGPVEDSERAAWKPSTDIVLEGFAYAPGGATSVVAELEIAGVCRRIRATGARHIVACDGTRSEWTMPAPFERVPLGRDRAYGGFDRLAFELHGDAAAEVAVEHGAELEVASHFGYPRNPRGVGFYLASVGAANRGRPVPSLDDPDDPVEPDRLIREAWDDWIDAPAPASWAWSELTDFPRCALMGFDWHAREAKRKIREIELGAISEADLQPPASADADVGPLPIRLLTEPRICLAAAPGMSGRRLCGGEPLILRHVEPNRAERTLALPKPQLGIGLRPPGCSWFDLEPQIDSLILRPERRELALVLSANLRIAAPYPAEELALVERSVTW